MAKIWDDLMKMLAKANPQSLVSLLLAGARFEAEKDTELKVRTVNADIIYNVVWKGKKIVLHVEFQRRRDKMMARRTWEYNVLTGCLLRRPVYSVVLYLVPDGDIVESPYEQKLPDGEVVHVFYFKNIKLWEIPVEVLTQSGLEGMLPLLPLAKDGARREVVEDMITGLKKSGKEDLLPLGYAFSALVYAQSVLHALLKKQ